MRIPGSRAVASGFAGACVLTLLHEAQRRVVKDPPRLDWLGMRAIAKASRAAGLEPPQGEPLRAVALAGDLAANTAYYSLAGLSRKPVLTGGLLGLAAGVGAVALPKPMGLGGDATARSPRTAAMSIALYTIAGLTAGAAYSVLTSNDWPEADWGEVFFP